MVLVAFVVAASAAAADSAGGSADESPNTTGGSEQDAPLKELDRVLLRFMTVRQARVFAVLRGTYPPRREDK